MMYHHTKYTSLAGKFLYVGNICYTQFFGHEFQLCVHFCFCLKLILIKIQKTYENAFKKVFNSSC